MAEHRRFYLVVDADVVTEGVTPETVLVLPDLHLAEQAAQRLCVTHPGKTFVPFSPGEGWRATEPRAQKVYLAWSTNEVAEEPPSPPPDRLEIKGGVQF